MSVSKRKTLKNLSTVSYTDTNSLQSQIKYLLKQINIFVKPTINKESIIIKLLKKNQHENTTKMSSNLSKQSTKKINKRYTEIGIIETYITYNNIPTKKRTRSSLNKETLTLNISWISIDSPYNGIGLGYFLIIYSIYLCNLYHTEIQYAVLDNVADKSLYIKGDIYKNLGFDYLHNTSISNYSSKKLIINGPEMILKMSDLMSQKAIHYLSNCIVKLKKKVNISGKTSTTNKSLTRKIKTI
jgi:hypothetical protein